MLEKILDLDTQLFIFLNGLGSETYDGLWLIITKQVNWIPFFLFLFYIIYKEIGIKKTGYLLLFIAVLVLATDQITNLFKYTFQRPRPCNNPEINSFIRIVQSRSSFSFFSGHAANTMAVATFLYFIFRKQIKYFWLLFLWPLIFAYSRIYLGLHYPLDIFSGYLCGLLLGYIAFKGYQFTQIKYFPL
ncbi:phosphatase PAP2 family protein [Flavobacterium aestuarii]|uniref:phosphatase PAP2 family protein n=1 Tax=Flavobacterium aestuarii TaxID=3149227 RepID=UPI0032B44A25